MKKIIGCCVLTLLFHYGNAMAATQKSVAVTAAQKRVALVIGNAKYFTDPGLAPLPSDEKDARDMANALTKFGFNVMWRKDLSYQEMHKALAEFSSKLEKDSIGLIYYSGHGSQVHGKQYLIPVDADLSKMKREVNPKSIDDGLLSASLININTHVLARIENKASLTMLIMDACRSNPFDNSDEITRKGGFIKKGIEKIAPVGGTLIASATASGTNSNGVNSAKQNSIYTAYLLEALQKQPSEEVVTLLRSVGTRVKNATKNMSDKQEPWLTMSFDGDFRFVNKIDDSERIKQQLAVQQAELAKQKAATEAALQAQKLAQQQAELIKQQKEAEMAALQAKNKALEAEKQLLALNSQANPVPAKPTLAEKPPAPVVDAQALVKQGEAFIKRKRIKQGCALFKQAAALGDADAKVYVAKIKKCR